MQRLALLFRNAHAIAKAGRPFSDMEWMCALDEKGLDVGASYRTDKKCCEFIHCIAEEQSALNRENLKSSCAAAGVKFQAPSRVGGTRWLPHTMLALKKLWSSPNAALRAELKSKRPRALTEEQKLDILVAYHSLQAEDAKEPLENPAQKPKGHYQQRVSALLGYSTKTVGLVYRDWHHHQQIHVAMPPANRLPKQQRIPKSNDVLLAVCTLVREQRSICHGKHLSKTFPYGLSVFREWLQCWLHVIPIRVPELWAYQASIFQAARNYEGVAWVAYDRQYRREALARKDTNWSATNSRLYNEAFTGRTKMIPRCRHCVSDCHITAHCTLDVSLGTTQVPTTAGSSSLGTTQVPTTAGSSSLGTTQVPTTAGSPSGEICWSYNAGPVKNSSRGHSISRERDHQRGRGRSCQTLTPGHVITGTLSVLSSYNQQSCALL
eukprot:Em0017g357a